jgi:hypothetical protein
MLSFEGRDQEEPHPLTEDCPSNEELTRCVLANYPQMIPRNFEISQLPDEISPFVELVMQTIEELSFMGHRKHLTGNKKGPSVGGDSSARKWELTTISLMTYPSVSRSSSAGPLSRPLVGTASTQQEAPLADVRTTWLRQLYELPQAFWVQRSNVTTGKVPSTSRETMSFARQYDNC